jgi:hypothetical protein
MPLSRISRRLLPIAVTALLGGYLGCAAHPSKSIYRLTNLDSQYFLLSPDVASTQGDHQALRIPRPHESGNAKDGPPMDCAIKSRWFSFYEAPGTSSDWVAETPSASAWQQSAGAIDMKDEWQNFERALDGLRQRSCFASPDEYLSVKQRIAASLSAPVADTLFYRYGYGPGGYIDLAPGMQLQIERDYIDSHRPDQPPSTNYQGTTITYYEVLGNIESGARLRFLRTEKRPAGSTTPDAKTSDVMLAADFATAPRLRLFLEDLVISGNAKSPAILIGAAITRDLDDVTQTIENEPAISCKALLRWQVTCASFDGLVTVSPMLPVFVNGSPSYLPIGSRLSFVIPHVTGSQQTSLIRTLRVQRSFQGKAVDVQFAHNIDGISQLLLFGGDRISWSRIAAAKR